MRSRALAIVLAVVLPVGVTATAQEIFSDGFEWGSICAWSNPWFPDLDEDGWGKDGVSGVRVSCPQVELLAPIAGDCDDTNPAVNPDAFEVQSNGADDDCDGFIDEIDALCDGGLFSGSSDPTSYVAALDLCRATSETGRGWGAIDAGLTLASGTGEPAAVSRSIRPGFGATNRPRAGQSMVVLSTGFAAAPGDTDPSHVAFQVGYDTGTESAAPADWLAANSNSFPTLPGCPSPASTTAFNPVALSLRIRVPSNAASFSVSAKFFSSEYPEWVCSAYNDFFVVLLDSDFDGEPPNPADKNLAVYTSLDQTVCPVGVGLAFVNAPLFSECLNGEIGCGYGAVAGTTISCTGVRALVGTGMDVVNPPGSPGWCGPSNLAGGGTGWMTIGGNVLPGEVMHLVFALWDTGDGLYDSVVLLDNFRWSVDSTEPGASME